MAYDFDEIIDRRGTHSVKWDSADDPQVLPMWIADMDFKPLPAITNSIALLAQKGHLGYNSIPAEFYEAIQEWWQRRHGYEPNRDLILPATGVVAGISAAISSLTEKGDEVIIQTPTYNHFYHVIEGCGCRVVENKLIYHEGKYTLDLKDLKQKASSEKARVLLLCNPQNPVGRAFNEEELDQLAAICSANRLTVISDEIHSDLVYSGMRHIPFVKFAARYDLPAVCVTSASKTFNLSGLQAAYLIGSEPGILKGISRQLWGRAAATPSLLAIRALSIAYREGGEWLSQMKSYLQDNYEFLKEFLAAKLPDLYVLPLEATYLVWIDCSALSRPAKEISDILLREAKVWVNPGEMYGAGGEHFLRLNIACPKSQLTEGLTRMEKLIRELKTPR